MIVKILLYVFEIRIYELSIKLQKTEFVPNKVQPLVESVNCSYQ